MKFLKINEICEKKMKFLKINEICEKKNEISENKWNLWKKMKFFKKNKIFKINKIGAFYFFHHGEIIELTSRENFTFLNS